METDIGVCNGCEDDYEFVVGQDTGFCSACPKWCGACRRYHSDDDGCKKQPQWRSVLAQRIANRKESRAVRQARSEGNACIGAG